MLQVWSGSFLAGSAYRADNATVKHLKHAQPAIMVYFMGFNCTHQERQLMRYLDNILRVQHSKQLLAFRCLLLYSSLNHLHLCQDT